MACGLLHYQHTAASAAIPMGLRRVCICAHAATLMLLIGIAAPKHGCTHGDLLVVDHPFALPRPGVCVASCWVQLLSLDGERYCCIALLSVCLQAGVTAAYVTRVLAVEQVEAIGVQVDGARAGAVRLLLYSNAISPPYLFRQGTVQQWA